MVADPKNVKAVQRWMTDLGYYRGGETGVVDPALRASINKAMADVAKLMAPDGQKPQIPATYDSAFGQRVVEGAQRARTQHVTAGGDLGFTKQEAIQALADNNWASVDAKIAASGPGKVAAGIPFIDGLGALQKQVHDGTAKTLQGTPLASHPKAFAALLAESHMRDFVTAMNAIAPDLQAGPSPGGPRPSPTGSKVITPSPTSLKLTGANLTRADQDLRHLQRDLDMKDEGNAATLITEAEKRITANDPKKSDLERSLMTLKNTGYLKAAGINLTVNLTDQGAGGPTPPDPSAGPTPPAPTPPAPTPPAPPSKLTAAERRIVQNSLNTLADTLGVDPTTPPAEVVRLADEKQREIEAKNAADRTPDEKKQIAVIRQHITALSDVGVLGQLRGQATTPPQAPPVGGPQPPAPTPPAPQPPAPPAPAASSAGTPADITTIQQNLKDLGYYNGAIDGKQSADLTKALNATLVDVAKLAGIAAPTNGYDKTFSDALRGKLEVQKLLISLASDQQIADKVKKDAPGTNLANHPDAVVKFMKNSEPLLGALDRAHGLSAAPAAPQPDTTFPIVPMTKTEQRIIEDAGKLAAAKGPGTLALADIITRQYSGGHGFAELTGNTALGDTKPGYGDPKAIEDAYKKALAEHGGDAAALRATLFGARSVKDGSQTLKVTITDSTGKAKEITTGTYEITPTRLGVTDHLAYVRGFGGSEIGTAKDGEARAAMNGRKEQMRGVLAALMDESAKTGGNDPGKAAKHFADNLAARAHNVNLSKHFPTADKMDANPPRRIDPALSTIRIADNGVVFDANSIAVLYHKKFPAEPGPMISRDDPNTLRITAYDKATGILRSETIDVAALQKDFKDANLPTQGNPGGRHDEAKFREITAKYPGYELFLQYPRGMTADMGYFNKSDLVDNPGQYKTLFQINEDTNAAAAARQKAEAEARKHQAEIAAKQKAEQDAAAAANPGGTAGRAVHAAQTPPVDSATAHRRAVVGGTTAAEAVEKRIALYEKQMAAVAGIAIYKDKHTGGSYIAFRTGPNARADQKDTRYDSRTGFYGDGSRLGNMESFGTLDINSPNVRRQLLFYAGLADEDRKRLKENPKKFDKEEHKRVEAALLKQNPDLAKDKAGLQKMVDAEVKNRGERQFLERSLVNSGVTTGSNEYVSYVRGKITSQDLSRKLQELGGREALDTLVGDNYRQFRDDPHFLMKEITRILDAQDPNWRKDFQKAQDKYDKEHPAAKASARRNFNAAAGIDFAYNDQGAQYKSHDDPVRAQFRAGLNELSGTPAEQVSGAGVAPVVLPPPPAGFRTGLNG